MTVISEGLTLVMSEVYAIARAVPPNQVVLRLLVELNRLLTTCNAPSPPQA